MGRAETSPTGATWWKVNCLKVQGFQRCANAPCGGERVRALLPRGDAHDRGPVERRHGRGLGALLGVARAQLPEAVAAPRVQRAVRAQRQRVRVAHLHLPQRRIDAAGSVYDASTQHAQCTTHRRSIPYSDAKVANRN
jgi:hypothetical protein